jgi:hypothetical protein
LQGGFRTLALFWLVWVGKVNFWLVGVGFFVSISIRRTFLFIFILILVCYFLFLFVFLALRLISRPADFIRCGKLRFFRGYCFIFIKLNQCVTATPYGFRMYFVGDKHAIFYVQPVR